MWSKVEVVLPRLVAMEVSKLSMGRLKDKPVSGLDKGVDLLSEVGRFKGLVWVTWHTVVDLKMDLLKLMLQGVMAIMLGLGVLTVDIAEIILGESLLDSVLVDTLILEGIGTITFRFLSLSSLTILFSILLTFLSFLTFSRFRFEFSSFNFLFTSC